MADITLTSSPVLGVDLMIGANRIVEHDDLALVSVAIPLGGAPRLAQALKEGWSLKMPDARQSSVSGNMRAIQTAPDQMMLIFPHSGPGANNVVRKKLNGAGYTTEQTDNWVVLEVSGPDTRMALERICPVDLHPDTFVVENAARTAMEHLGVWILRIGSDTYLLMSPSSSAQSFLHAIETSFHVTT